MLLQYAWKGFWRRRTRSILTILGVALSVGLLVAVVTVSRSVEQAVSSSLDAAGADMVVQKRVKACPFSIIKLPKDLAAINAQVVEKLREHPSVQEISGVLELWAFHEDESKLTQNMGFPKPKEEAAAGAGSVANDVQGLPMIGGKALQPTVVAGIDPGKKTIGPVRVASRTEGENEEGCCAVTRGRYLVPNDDYHAMITEDYAKAKGLDIGDMIPLGLEHKFEVVALLDMSGAARIAGAEAFIPLKTAQQLLAQGAVVDTIFISLKHGRETAKVVQYATELIGEGVSVTTEGNVEAGTAALASVTRNSLLAISGMVLLFAMLLLVRNALDNVAHRVAEVGLMKAIGWRNGDVSRLFVAEAGYAGLIGGLLGSIIGGAAGWAYGNFANLKLPESLNPSPPCSATEAPLALPLTTDPTAMTFVLGLGVALLIGMIAGLAASRRAAGLNPMDALRRL